MKEKEKEYLVAFKLYIEHYDPRYRYPKWIKATSKKDAIAKYMAIIKPDLALGACIIMDERPVKQDETKEADAVENHKNINDVYREGNLKLLELMIDQLNKIVDPTNPNHTPRPFIVDMDKINEQLCSTSKLASMLSSGIGHDMLPYNGSIYTDDFFERVNEYMNTKYKYDFYDDYTLMKIRGDLQCMYNDYNRRGILPWETKKLEDAVCGTSEVMNVSDAPSVVNRDDPNEDKTLVIKIIKQRTDEKDKTPDMGEAEHDKETGLCEYTGDLSHYSGLTEEANMKESIVKGERTNTTERVALDILDHEPIFDIEAAGLDKGYAYLLETIHDDGSVERKVIVIIDISPERIVYIWRETSHDTVRREGTLTPRGFENGKYKLYPITAEDIK